MLRGLVGKIERTLRSRGASQETIDEVRRSITTTIVADKAFAFQLQTVAIMSFIVAVVGVIDIIAIASPLPSTGNKIAFLLLTLPVLALCIGVLVQSSYVVVKMCRQWYLRHRACANHLCEQTERFDGTYGRPVLVTSAHRRDCS